MLAEDLLANTISPLSHPARDFGIERLPGLGVFDYGLGIGDLLLLYTDGMSELRRHREMLEVEGLWQWLRECPAEAPGEVVRRLYERAREWSGDQFGDDIALVALRCRQLSAISRQ